MLKRLVQQTIYRIGLRPKEGSFFFSHWLDMYFRMAPWQRQIAASYFEKARTKKRAARKQLKRLKRRGKKAGKRQAKRMAMWVDDKPVNKAARLIDKRSKS